MQLKNAVGIILCLVLLISLSTSVVAVGQALNITITELASQRVAYDPDNGERNSGTSATGVSLRSLWLNGTLVITNIAGETLSDLNVTVVNTSRMTDQFIIHYQPSYTNLNLTPFASGNPIYIYIRELQAGDNVTLNYSADPSALGEPINITETFTKTKVLTNSTFNITINVTNKLTANVPITNLNLTKTPVRYVGADGLDRFFNYTFVVGDEAEHANIVVSGGRSILEWNTSAGTLTSTETANITLGVRAPVDLNGTFDDPATWSQYMGIGNISVKFLITRALTDIRITNVTGVAKAQVGVLKTRINESHWRIGANFTNKAEEIDYNLTSVTVWATYYNQFSDPGNITTWVNNTKQPYANPESYQETTVGFEINESPIRGLDIDLNKDRIYEDMASVFNETHLLFNMSGNKFNYTKLLDKGVTPLDISNCEAVPVDIEINESNITINNKVYGSFMINGTCIRDNSFYGMTFYVNTTKDRYARYKWTLNQRIANGAGWQNDTFTFNYSLVPVEWADASFTIWDGDGTQIFRKYRSMEHPDYGYYYYEEILVLSGYIMKASKYIEPSNVFDNVYNVTVVLENIGNDKTPDLVTVFDMIPNEFWVLNLTNNVTELGSKNMVLNENINVTMSNHTRGVYNSGYIDNPNSLFNNYWGFRVDLSQFDRFSNGDGAYQIENNKSEVRIFYMINGTGQLAQVRDAFVIGVDPVRLEGAYPSKPVQTHIAVDSSSKEILVLIASIVLSAGILAAAYYGGRREYL